MTTTTTTANALSIVKSLAGSDNCEIVEGAFKDPRLQVVWDINKDNHYLLTPWGRKWRIIERLDKFRELVFAVITGNGVIYETQPMAGNGYQEIRFWAGDISVILDHHDFSDTNGWDPEYDDHGYTDRWQSLQDTLPARTQL